MEQHTDGKLTRKAKGRQTIYKAEQDVNLLMMIDDLKKRGGLAQDALMQIMTHSSSILQNEPTMLKLASPITVVGDIHGQFYDLLNIFQKFGWPPNTSYLFLGDYVDRGKFCIEVMTLLLKLKLLYPDKIYLLRGNHEGRTMTSFFNFKLECQKKYTSEVYERFLDLFMTLPLCALIDNKYFAVHGGISPKLNHLYEIERVNRFIEISEELPMSDLLWSDPSDERSENWSYNKLRCCSYTYSSLQSEQFLKANQLKLIIRGHEVTAKGYKYQYNINNAPLTLTIFSAPNYCDSYHNKAVAAQIKGDEIEIKSFKEVEHPFMFDNYMNVFDFTLPILTSSVTKIFKHILKVTQGKGKMKRSSQQKKEDIKAMMIVESIEKSLSENSNVLMEFLLNHMSRDKIQAAQATSERDTQNSENDGFTEEMLMKFLAMKMNDSAEKLPVTFGPRRVEFVRIKEKKKREEEAEECHDEGRIFAF